MLRETSNFKAEPSKTGVRITCKCRGVVPKSRVISQRDYNDIRDVTDPNFDEACCKGHGIGSCKRGIKH